MHSARRLRSRSLKLKLSFKRIVIVLIAVQSNDAPSALSNLLIQGGDFNEEFCTQACQQLRGSVGTHEWVTISLVASHKGRDSRRSIMAWITNNDSASLNHESRFKLLPTPFQAATPERYSGMRSLWYGHASSHKHFHKTTWGIHQQRRIASTDGHSSQNCTAPCEVPLWRVEDFSLWTLVHHSGLLIVHMSRPKHINEYQWECNYGFRLSTDCNWWGCRIPITKKTNAVHEVFSAKLVTVSMISSNIKGTVPALLEWS